MPPPLAAFRSSSTRHRTPTAHERPVADAGHQAHARVDRRGRRLPGPAQTAGADAHAVRVRGHPIVHPASRRGMAATAPRAARAGRVPDDPAADSGGRGADAADPGGAAAGDSRHPRTAARHAVQAERGGHAPAGGDGRARALRLPRPAQAAHRTARRQPGGRDVHGAELPARVGLGRGASARHRLPGADRDVLPADGLEHADTPAGRRRARRWISRRASWRPRPTACCRNTCADRSS